MVPIYAPKSAVALVVIAVVIVSIASLLYVAGAVSADAARVPVIAGFAIAFATLLWIAKVRRRDRRPR